ncbi:MAG: hypothetical protein RBQ97_11985 [Acholeplasma sp.]|nr:hypothetical protein [Acholeplasma sp.]
MNKQDYNNLIERAKPFINNELMVNIGLKKTINLKSYKFIDIQQTVGFSEEGKDFNFTMPSAIVINDKEEKRLIPLIEVVEYFEKSKTV